MLNCGLFSHDAWSTEQAAFDHLVIFTSVNIGYSSLYRWLRCILRLYLPVYVSILNCYIIDQREDFLQVLESYTLVKCLLHDGKEFLVRITKQQWKEWMLIFLAGTNKLIVLNKNEYFDIGWNRLENSTGMCLTARTDCISVVQILESGIRLQCLDSGLKPSV